LLNKTDSDPSPIPLIEIRSLMGRYPNNEQGIKFLRLPYQADLGNNKSCISPSSNMSIQIETLEQLQAMIPNTAAEALGIEVVGVDESQIILRLQITDKTRQPMGLLHGGISMLLAESAASMHACWGMDISKTVPVGIEVNGSHIRSASEGFVLAKATLVRKSQTLAVHSVEIIDEETERVLCVARITNFYKQRNV
jgi:1,4-dihydroxy-2-naphthoyl-CoA hydrolase